MKSRPQACEFKQFLVTYSIQIVMEQASLLSVSSYFHETDPLKWSLIDFLKWRLEASDFLSKDKEHGTFKYSVEKSANIWKDEINVQKAQEILDNWKVSIFSCLTQLMSQ